MNTSTLLSKKSRAKNQVLYRIFTEDKEEYRNRIIDSLKSRGIPYFTIVGRADGYGPEQGGLPEKSVIIEVASDDSLPNLRAIRDVVNDIHRDNTQQSVMVVGIPVAWVDSRRERQLQLPIEGILKPKGKLGNKSEGKPWIEARMGKWEMLLKVAEANLAEV